MLEVVGFGGVLVKWGCVELVEDVDTDVGVCQK